MVKVKSPLLAKQESDRLVRQLFLLGLALLCLCGTLIVVNDVSVSRLIGRADIRSARRPSNQIPGHFIYITPSISNLQESKRVTNVVKASLREGYRFFHTEGPSEEHARVAEVGDGWTEAAAELNLDRADVWFQSTFSPAYPHKEDYNFQHHVTHHHLPYDPHLPIAEQARKALELTLEGLQISYLDSWIVRMDHVEVFSDLIAVWRAMEEAVDEGYVKQIGLSNIDDMDSLKILFRQARHLPAVLQQPFSPDHDRFRTQFFGFAKAHSIRYQVTSLNDNRYALQQPEIATLASTKGLEHNRQVLESFLLSLGDVDLITGPSRHQQIRENLGLVDAMQPGTISSKLQWTAEEIHDFTELLGCENMRAHIQ